MKVSVTLPWPPVASSLNGSQGDFRAKATAGRQYKAACWDACKTAKLARMNATAADVTIVFHPAAARVFDLDNTLARCKRGLDAVAEAIGIDDGRWATMTLKRGQPTPGGAVVVSITPTAWQPAGSAARRSTRTTQEMRG